MIDLNDALDHAHHLVCDHFILTAALFEYYDLKVGISINVPNSIKGAYLKVNYGH